MLSSEELLALMERRKIRRADIARALNVDPARVTEMYKGERRIRLDEAARLVEAFGLDATETTLSPLSVPIARLLVLYASRRIGRPLAPDDPLVEDLALDFQAFSEFALDSEVRDSAEAIQGFFQALELAARRRAPADVVPESRRQRGGRVRSAR